MRGIFVSVEGVEGSGKSTQCGKLAETLRARGLDVVLTREPDGTSMGVQLRRLFEVDGPPLTPLTQVFLFMAARQQHVAEVVRPAVSRGAVVLSDRYTDATMAYQGFGEGVDLDTIHDLNALATGGLLPDLTLVLDLEPTLGMARIRGRVLDAFERMDLAFHRRVREGYLEIARTEKRRVVVLDADQGEDALFAAIVAAVDDRLVRRDSARAG